MKTTLAVENAKELFGEHPEDVISSINGAAEALGWLEEIFATIKNEADDARNRGRIKKLAAAGEYLAFDYANFTACKHEEYRDRLKAAGLIDSGEVAA
jgi:hypothetical protein